MSSTYSRLFALPLLAAVAVIGAGAAPAHAQSPSEAEIISLTNQERQKHGLPPLTQNATLGNVAENYAALMARLQKMDHHLDGSDAGGRLAGAGYHSSWWGENIAFGYPDASAVVRGWMNSPEHRKNILNPNFTEIGLGVAYSSGGVPYYCQVFAQPTGK